MNNAPDKAYPQPQAARGGDGRTTGGDATGAAPVSGGESQRERIETGPDLHRVADDAWAALIDGNDERHPSVMVRGNQLVRMTERGELEPHTRHSLRDRLSRAANFGSEGDHGWAPRKPSMEVVDMLLARDSSEYDAAPRVDRVVDAPVLTPTGGIIDRPGHHPGARLFYKPAPAVERVRVSAVEYVDDVIAARDFLLRDWLSDFEFVHEASRAHALGLALLPLVREVIGDAPTPLHTIGAMQPGMGKGTLAKTLLVPSGGLPAMIAETRSNEEMRKRMTAALLRGASAIVFDNVSAAIDSPALAALLTAELWRDRILGESREVVIPIRNAWVATANNLNVSSEIADRCCPILLECGERTVPRQRRKEEFRHADIVGWTQASRAHVLDALLTLVRHWLDGHARLQPDGSFFREESRTGTERTLGSFERWSEVIGGILRVADVPGFLGNRDQFMDEADIETEDCAAFLQAWYALASEPVAVRDLLVMCQYDGSLHDVLPLDLAARRDLAPALGAWLRDHKGKRYAGYRVAAEPASKGGRHKLWRVAQHT